MGIDMIIDVSREECSDCVLDCLSLRHRRWSQFRQWQHKFRIRDVLLESAFKNWKAFRRRAT